MSRPDNTGRIVITGMGMVSPLGPDVESSWRTLLQGTTAIRALAANEIDRFDLLCDFLGQVPAGAPVCLKDDDPADSDILQAIFDRAAAEALASAGQPLAEYPSDRVACVFGTSKGSLRAFDRHRPGAEKPFDFRRLWPSTPASRFAAQNGIGGPVLAPVAACATGVVAIQRAVRMIQEGDADIAVAGSADASLCSSVFGSFRRLGVLSRTSDPASACRPFDVQRDGFLPGEGGAVVILESLTSAQQRKARCRAEVLAATNLTDPTGLTQIDLSGEVVAQLIAHLMRSASLSAGPDYINAHGTGTVPNDLAEARGIVRAFGERQPYLSGMKGAIGHLLGGAGSVEFVLTLKSLEEQTIPAVRNLSTLDNGLRIRPVLDQCVETPVDTALKLSLGFGGHTAGCLVRRLD